MKKIINKGLVVCFMLILSSCSVGNGKIESTKESVSIINDNLKEILVEGTELNIVRPSENELSEEEILQKIADTVIELGYYNTDFADEIDPRLKDCKLKAPEYVYITNPNIQANGYYCISAVDNNKQTVASLTCNAEIDRRMDDFIGSYGPCVEGTYDLDRKDVIELMKDKYPDKVFSDPELVSVKLENSNFYSVYWYTAAIDKTSNGLNFSKSLSKDSNVEEFLIGSEMLNYYPSKIEKASKGITANFDSVIWEGILKVDESLGYYKVIEANKTIVDVETKSAKAFTLNSSFSEYRGKNLVSVHTGVAKATRVL